MPLLRETTRLVISRDDRRGQSCLRRLPEAQGTAVLLPAALPPPRFSPHLPTLRRAEPGPRERPQRSRTRAAARPGHGGGSAGAVGRRGRGRAPHCGQLLPLGSQRSVCLQSPDSQPQHKATGLSGIRVGCKGGTARRREEFGGSLDLLV